MGQVKSIVNLMVDCIYLKSNTTSSVTQVGNNGEMGRALAKVKVKSQPTLHLVWV